MAFAHSAASFPFAWHYHPEYELTLIEAGEGTRFVGDSIAPFAASDLALLGGNLPHTWSSEGRRIGPNSHCVIVVHFSPDLFASEATEFRSIRHLLKQAERGCVFSPVVRAKAASGMRKLLDLHGLAAWCQLATILHLLAGDPAPVPLASAGYVPTLRQGDQRRLERALGYVETHADSEHLSLQDVARTVHLSPAAFSRFFRKMTGGTLVGHVNQLRIGRACRLLNESDKSVAEIAYACGFRNLANFNRRFRMIKGMTPSVYREHFKSAVPSPSANS